LENVNLDKPTGNGINIGSLALSPSESMMGHGPFTITPSNLFMASNTTTNNQGVLLTATNKTPKGLLTNKPSEKGK
jgi:hypothetical protein